MKILHVCSEFYPLLKTGGLADVTGALPKYQCQAGSEARVLLPAFPAIKAGIEHTDFVAQVDTFAGQVTIRYGMYNQVGVYLIDAPHLYERDGNPYHDGYQNAYGDNHLRFGLLGFIASELALGLDFYWQPEILHCHDWHAGLAPAYLKARSPQHSIKTVFTIHNLAYQGCFDSYNLDRLWLPHHFFAAEGLEFYGQISFLKAGLYYSDHITAVSPTYAKEILSPYNAYGFDGLLQRRAQSGQLSGILNGIDENIWDPRNDRLISTRYNKRNLRQKMDNKQELQEIFNLTVDSNIVMFAVISRLVDQKGIDLILAALPHLLNNNAQLVVLGDGDEHFKQAFEHILNEPCYQGKIGLYFGFNEQLSHQMIAGADIIMVPSRFEPCGLTQLYGLKYGTLPLVHHTGGLADTVVNSTPETINSKSATGFVFYHPDLDSLNNTIDHILVHWKDRTTWRKLQQQAMSQDYSWAQSEKKYLQLYRSL